ncbi:MAG: hypothetical protein AAF388_03535 [Bacteroidota bacterium]
MLKNNTIKILLVLGIILFLTGFGYLGVDYYNKVYQSKVDQAKIEALNSELLELERNVLELEVLFDDKDLEVEKKDELLRQGYDRIRYLEDEINRLEKEGKLSKAQIAELRNKLKEAKANMLDKYQKELEAVYADNRRLKGIVDSILSEDGVRADMIAQMMSQVNLLQKKNTSLQDTLSQAQTIVSAVERLKAENFKFYSVKNGKTEEQKIRFKLGTLKDLRVEIELIDNALAEPGVYDLYLALRAPDATIMTNRSDGHGGSVKFDSKSILYSAHTSVYYDRQRKPFYFDFRPSTSEPFVKGNYNVVVYCKGEKIGEEAFTVF